MAIYPTPEQIRRRGWRCWGRRCGHGAKNQTFVSYGGWSNLPYNGPRERAGVDAGAGGHALRGHLQGQSVEYSEHQGTLPNLGSWTR